jgi:uncharacterized membrane-anchored protein
MKKYILALVLVPVFQVCLSQAHDPVQAFIDSLEASLHYQEGVIPLENGIGNLNVPEGFHYLDAQQSAYVLQELWGNPDGSGTLGMILPKTAGVLADNSWAFIISYEEMGYVKDDDASEIDYDDLMDDMRSETESENEERNQIGYEPIELIGWASKPFYDQERKVLHWAKEFKFGNADVNTLNYNVRILGRKGVLVLNAVAAMSDLSEVQKSINPVLSSFAYADGSRYSDFNPEIDDVAAWTIGGLVAGKVLAKAGIFAFLLKYLKLIGLGIIAIGGACWRWYKRKTELPDVKKFPEHQSTNTHA